MIDFPTFSYTSASKSSPFYIHEAQIMHSFWAEPPRIGHCREYSLPPPPGYVSIIFPSLNLNKSLNIHKETVSYRTLILPIKVNQLPSYRTSKISLNKYQKSPMIEETSSKLLWCTKSDKEVRYYNPSAHCNVQRFTKLLNER